MTHSLRYTLPTAPARLSGPYSRARALTAAAASREGEHPAGTLVEVLRGSTLVQGWRYDGERWRAWPRTDGGKATTRTAQLALRCTPEERQRLEAAGLTGRRAVEVLLREAGR